ncbi:MAG: hypothetical protein HY077_06685 [Elusimicrobia bacterium]|nr:hypothetical protein [Elusimicrobiota bacterium]
MDEAQPPPQRRSWLAALLVVLAIGGSAVGVFIYQLLQGNRKSSLDASGFDIAQTTDNTPRPTSTPVAQPQSSLGVISTGLSGIHFGRTAGPGGTPAQQAEDAASKAAETFSQLCVRNEAKVRSFAEKYTKQSPTLQKYGREWMSYPDLKKLNDDYMRNHDPIAFLRGLTQSANFPKLVKKYAGDSSMQGFVRDGMKQTPPELLNSGISYMNKDNVVKQLVTKVMESLGIPAMALGAAPGAGQLDPAKIMGSVLGNNPQLQKAMESNPEIQKKLQNNPGLKQNLQEANQLQQQSR